MGMSVIAYLAFTQGSEVNISDEDMAEAEDGA
jgi:hypothetical protein